MSQYPPYPPAARAYSPSRAYGEEAPYTSSPATSRDYSGYTYPGSTAASTFRPYDAYGSEPVRPPFPYEQPRRAYEDDSYDPYQPSAKAFDPNVSQYRAAAPTLYNPVPQLAPPRSPPQSYKAPVSANPHYAPTDGPELTLLTPPTTVSIGPYPTAIYTLPASHLPITKYVSLNRDEALELHRQLCSKPGIDSVWYADGSSRAGEGWSAAVEYILDPGRSGSKMRGCVGDGDALDSELGGICKAVEGFQEALRQAIKDGKSMSHELIVFCDSPAAIVGIDTSSRAESLRFDKFWRNICTDYLYAHLTLAWLPKDSNIEGHILADKIATVGASNSYLKKRKERTLPEIYRRAGGGDPAATGSSEGGPWQRGDADPSRRKSPFDRPKPLSPPPLRSNTPNDLHLQLAAAPIAAGFPAHEPEEEVNLPRKGSIFVTDFPDVMTARDIGILFAQYGGIDAVDIYHITVGRPRFALVTYTETACGLAAIRDLNGRRIDLDSPFARENGADLHQWIQSQDDWSGRLTVIPTEHDRLVPSSVASRFNGLPDWALGARDDAQEAERMEVDAQIRQERESSQESSGRKRERPPAPDKSPSPSHPISPLPHKRLRQLSPPNEGNETDPPVMSSLAQAFQAAIKTADTMTDIAADAAWGSPGNKDLLLQPKPKSPGGSRNMPPFAPTLNGNFTPEHVALPSTNPIQPAELMPNTKMALPPTPTTAERPQSTKPISPGRQSSLEPSSQSKRLLTNSAAEPQEYPIKIGAKTLRAQVSLVRASFAKVEATNWIAHTCFIASDLDQARRVLKDDLYATDTAFLTGRDLEQSLSARGFTAQKINTFVTKVLNVLDGIAAAEEGDAEGNVKQMETVEDLEKDLQDALLNYPDQTREAVMSASTVLEYLVRGKEAQEGKRLELERRVKVLEGMVKKGEVVSKVVNYLLTEDR